MQVNGLGSFSSELLRVPVHAVAKRSGTVLLSYLFDDIADSGDHRLRLFQRNHMPALLGHNQLAAN